MESTTSEQLVGLLEATARSDVAAFERLYQLTSAKLFGLCRQVINDPAGAEDVLQEAYVQIWRESPRYDARRASAMTWMGTIVRRRAIDEVRKRARGERRLAEWQGTSTEATGADQLESLIAASASNALMNCLQELGGGQKDAIALAFFRGLSHAELARALEVPLGSIKTWIRRGMDHLRVCLQR
ncbi:MAG: sigma-70 family RNA polymerase sigma factor [Pseudomonadota bacterium]